MCLAQGPQRSDAGEARTRYPSVSSQALYHNCFGIDQHIIPFNLIYINKFLIGDIHLSKCSPKLLDLQHGDVPRYPSYGVYISQLIHYARVCSLVDDFINRNKVLTSKLLEQGYRYHKQTKAFFINYITDTQN